MLWALRVWLWDLVQRSSGEIGCTCGDLPHLTAVSQSVRRLQFPCIRCFSEVSVFQILLLASFHVLFPPLSVTPASLLVLGLYHHQGTNLLWTFLCFAHCFVSFPTCDACPAGFAFWGNVRTCCLLTNTLKKKMELPGSLQCHFLVHWNGLSTLWTQSLSVPWLWSLSCAQSPLMASGWKPERKTRLERVRTFISSF